MGRLSSNFGPRGGKMHSGTDYAASAGTPIYANGPMTVTGVYPNGSAGQTGYGNTVTLKDANGVEYRHAHLNSVPNLQPGQQVGAGDLVGNVGNTGNSSGPHDHFEVSTAGNINGKQGLQSGEAIDPKTGKAYSDSFSMGSKDAGSLNSERGGTGVEQGHEHDNDPKPTDKPPTPPVTTDPAPKAPPTSNGKRVHRLTDRNSAGGVIDECVAKTVFVNNLPISVDGSKGTGHPAGSDPADRVPTNTRPGGATPRRNPNTNNCAGERPSPNGGQQPPQPQAPQAPAGPAGNIVDLGRQLQGQGIRVSEHPAFGGVEAGVHRGRGHGDGRAIDVNAPGGIVEANDPTWGPRFDAIAQQARAQGFTVIWRSAGHYNHMHIEEPAGGLRPNANPPNPAAPPNPNLPAGATGDCVPGDNAVPAPSPPAQADHCYHCWQTANGSRNVFVENLPVNFEGNLDTCGHARIEGSPDVFVGENSNTAQDRPLGSDRAARNTKEANKGGGNASPSNVACRQAEVDKNEKENKPADDDPNKDGPQKQADADDPNKPVDAKPGVTGEGQASSEQASRDRLRAQMDQDYANRDQWQGGKRSPAGNAAFANLGYGNAANGTAWCAAYVNSNLKDSGAGYASSLAAASPKAYKPVEPGQAKPGDVLVFDGGRHTALVYDVKPNGDIILQGGNQGGGDGAVTRNTITAASGYQYGSQRVSGIYNPHDQEYNRNNNLNVVPNGRDNPGYTPGAGNNANPGKDCPPQTPQEQAAGEGQGTRPELGGDSRFPGDVAFPNPSSILGGILGGGGGIFGGGPTFPTNQGPYPTPPKIDPMKIAAEVFDASMDDNTSPPISPLNTCDRARELAKTATGKEFPSGTEVAAQVPAAQKLWWDEAMAANQYRYEAAVEAYKQAGITAFRPLSAESMTRIMAYQSGWGNSRCVSTAAYDKNNPIGIGWNGSTFYEYPDKQLGWDATWKFIAFGTEGSLGRYLLPADTPLETDFEIDYIYKQGLINGQTPPGVLLIKPPQ